MRNLLAFLAAAVLTFVGLGWYLGWYQVKSQAGPDGHHNVNIDINKTKIARDVHEGVKEGEEKLQKVIDEDAPRADGPVLDPPSKQIR